MDQKFVDAITNVRLVSGTIRIDLMNITGQTEDNKLQFSKTVNLFCRNRPLARLCQPCRKWMLRLRNAQLPLMITRKNHD